MESLYFPCVECSLHYFEFARNGSASLSFSPNYLAIAYQLFDEITIFGPPTLQRLIVEAAGYKARGTIPEAGVIAVAWATIFCIGEVFSVDFNDKLLISSVQVDAKVSDAASTVAAKGLIGFCYFRAKGKARAAYNYPFALQCKAQVQPFNPDLLQWTDACEL
ncbi:hypothetical protein KSP39_PZI013350 [Platanthera zijinensis]|uniref:Uncharacterized protein n=1 Tax=Platanthera zijinensis TaxID=2320716 RepID=A0AAP0BDC7_9ASPA